MELPDRSSRDSDASELLALAFLRLRADVVGWLGNPPDVANITEEHWQRLQDELAAVLGLILLGTWTDSAALHGASGDDRRSAAIAAGLPWSKREAARLAALITGTTRKRIEEDGADDSTLSDLFGLRRAILIGSDAVTNGQHNGAEFAVEHYGGGLSEEDRWKTVDAPCAVCSPLDGQPRSVWEAQFPEGPPIPHPYCKCYIEFAGMAAA